MSQAESTVDVFIAYDDPEHVTSIRNGMVRKVPPRILGPTLGEVPQLVLAGSIAVRLLVSGLIDWTQRVNGITLVCERDPEDGTIIVHPEESRNVRRVIVAGPKGQTTVFDLASSHSSDVEAAIKALLT